MRLLVLNPNSTPAMTAKIGREAEAVAAVGTEILAVNPQGGPASIEGHYDEAVAVIGLLEELRRAEGAGIDATVIACFGDPGLLAAREILSGPVLGIAEAAMHAASLVSSGFSIVTTLARTCAIAEHLVVQYGMERRCRKVRATDLPVLDLDAEPDGTRVREILLAESRRALAEDGSDAIVLGCAGMTDLTADLSRTLGVPVIDGVAVAVKFAESLVSLGLRTAKTGPLAYPLPKLYRGATAGLAP